MPVMLPKYHLLILTVLAVAVTAVGVVFFREDVVAFISLINSERTHAAVVIGCFLILPMLFFPISALLLLIGLRFDALVGTLIMFALIPAHLLVAYFLVQSIFHGRIEAFAKQRARHWIRIPPDRHLEFALLFMAVPGLPYAVKNYLLPFSGVPFRQYFWVSWLVQGVMGVPFVVLGDAASKWNIPLFFIACSLILAVFLIIRFLRKRYQQLGGAVHEPRISTSTSAKRE